MAAGSAHRPCSISLAARRAHLTPHVCCLHPLILSLGCCCCVTFSTSPQVIARETKTWAGGVRAGDDAGRGAGLGKGNTIEVCDLHSLACPPPCVSPDSLPSTSIPVTPSAPFGLVSRPACAARSSCACTRAAPLNLLRGRLPPSRRLTGASLATRCCRLGAGGTSGTTIRGSGSA